MSTRLLAEVGLSDYLEGSIIGWFRRDGYTGTVIRPAYEFALLIEKNKDTLWGAMEAELEQLNRFVEDLRTSTDTISIDLC